MSSPTRASRLIGRQRLPRSQSGMLSLVELMVVVLIISMLFFAAVPAYQRIQLNARAVAIANDFRVFGAVFQTFAHDRGTWPKESGPGELPEGITKQEIPLEAWTRRTPMGGRFNWENNQMHPGGTSPGGRWRAAVAITGVEGDPLVINGELLEKIDEALDDGVLTTGNFRTGFGDCPLLILEP